MGVPALRAAAEAPWISAQHKLDAVRTAIEQKFLRAGDALSDAIEGVNTLVGSLERLADTLNEGVARETTDQLQAASESLVALPGAHATRRNAIVELSAQARALAEHVDALKTSYGYLRLISVNLRMAAPGVSTADGEFSTFIEGIQKRITGGRQELDDFAAEAEALRRQLLAALADEEALARHCDGMLRQTPAGLTSDAAAITAHQSRIFDATTKLAGPARSVQRQVGGALAALQIGDITRQRIEHVCAGLEMLADSTATLTADQRTRFEHFVNRLLAAQALAAAQDFHENVGRIEAEMSGIAAEAQEIMRLKDAAYGGAEEPSFLDELDKHVGEAVSVVAEMDEAARATIAVGRTAADTVKALTQRIRAIRAIRRDVQDMALNTTLKCSRLGDPGRPLNVIAVELRMHAANLEEAAQKAGAALDELARNAEILTANAAERSPGESAAETLRSVAARIHAANEAVEDELGKLSARGAGFATTIKQSALALQFERELGSLIDESVGEIQHLSAAAAPAVDDIAEPLTNYLTALARIYTMASERDVHRDRCADLPAAAPPPEAPPTAANDDDVFF